jgi:hypothetical protein
MKLFRSVPLGRAQAVNDACPSATGRPATCSARPPPRWRLQEAGQRTRIVFSGDVGRFGAVLTKDPELAPDADYLVIESTYGNRTHPEITVLDQLEGVLKRTFARNGVLLIPAFAVGRAQQMILLMDQLVTEGRLRPFPIHVDSPMAIDATRIYAQVSRLPPREPQHDRRAQPAPRQVGAPAQDARGVAGAQRPEGPGRDHLVERHAVRRPHPPPLPGAAAEAREHALDHRLPGRGHARPAPCSTAPPRCGSTRASCRSSPRSAT